MKREAGEARKPRAFFYGGFDQGSVYAEVLVPVTKKCSRCGGSGPFAKNKSRPDGLDHICKACRKPICGAWYRANAEKVKRDNHAEYWSDPEPHRERSSRWAKGHRGARRIIDQRHRAKKSGTESSLTEAQWQEILEFFGLSCAYCRRTDRRLTQDHVIAASRGGGLTAENIVPSCGSCNCRKKDRPVWVMAGL